MTFGQKFHCQSTPRCPVLSDTLHARASSIQALDGTAEWAVHRKASIADFIDVEVGLAMLGWCHVGPPETDML